MRLLEDRDKNRKKKMFEISLQFKCGSQSHIVKKREKKLSTII